MLTAIYRLGSAVIATIMPSFIANLNDVFDWLATFVEPVFIAGDLNVNLE